MMKILWCVMSNFEVNNISSEKHEDYLDEIRFQREARHRNRKNAIKILIVATLLVALIVLWHNLFLLESALYDIFEAEYDEVTISAYIKNGAVYVDAVEMRDGIIRSPKAWQIVVKSLFGVSESEEVLYAHKYAPNMIKNDWYLLNFRDLTRALKLWGQEYTVYVTIELYDGKKSTYVFRPFQGDSS